MASRQSLPTRSSSHLLPQQVLPPVWSNPSGLSPKRRVLHHVTLLRHESGLACSTSPTRRIENTMTAFETPFFTRRAILQYNGLSHDWTEGNVNIEMNGEGQRTHGTRMARTTPTLKCNGSSSYAPAVSIMRGMVCLKTLVALPPSYFSLYSVEHAADPTVQHRTKEHNAYCRPNMFSFTLFRPINGPHCLIQAN